MFLAVVLHLQSALAQEEELLMAISPALLFHSKCALAQEEAFCNFLAQLLKSALTQRVFLLCKLHHWFIPAGWFSADGSLWHSCDFPRIPP